MKEYKKIYHATNIDIENFTDKKPTFFTGTLELAHLWGQEHYDDYEIIVLFVPKSAIVKQYALKDYEFEQLEVKGMSQDIDVIRHTCNDGYMVRDLSMYNKCYYGLGEYDQLNYDFIN